MDNENNESSSGESSDDESLPPPEVRDGDAGENEFDIVLADQGASEDEEPSDSFKRIPYNRQLPSTHQYLDLPRYDDNFFDYTPLEPNTTLSVSVIKLPIVMFPNQLLPFHARDNVTVRQLMEASKTGALIALKPDFVANFRKIATLIQVVQVSSVNDEGTISIHALGRQRCKIIKERSAINGMKYGCVKILRDRELEPFIPYDLPRGLAVFKPAERLAVYSHLTAHQNFIIKQAATKNFVQQILQWLSSWFPSDKIAENLSKGLTSFSFWVAANIPVDTLIRLSLLEESCTDRRLINECFHLRKVDRIVCRRCGTVLCSLSDIISISADGNSALYVNPDGYVHDMFTVSKLNSTTPQGESSARFSWFPGYKWTIHNCARCHNFIGWRFTNKLLEPRFFYGISRTMVCPRGRNQAVNEGVRESFDDYLFLNEDQRSAL